MKKQKLVWHTEKRKVKSLIPYDKNPRNITKTQEDQLDSSVDTYGYVELVAINTDGVIIAGHRRVESLKRLGRGEEEIEVRVPNRKLSEKEFRAYLLISNRSGGTFDFEKLASDFDIDELLTAGFDSLDLSNIFDDNLEVFNDEFNEEKEIKEAKKTNIKLGDMFSFGSHFLICGDSTNPEVVKRLVGKNKIDLINIDFPYNIGIDYNSGLSGKQNYGGKINDKKSDAEYKKFLTDILSNALSVTKDDCHIFTWLDEKYIGMMQEIHRSLNINFKRLCLWAKGSHNPTPQIAFNRAVELCMYSIKGKPYLSDKIKNLTEFQNKDITTGNRLIDDIMDIFQIWLVKRLPGSLYEHSTMKPPTLYEKSLRRCSKPGDGVLDLTAGSGSLMVACEALKRRAYLADVEPAFCQLILNRFSKISNEKIIKLN
ncbi:MAG: DNA modification methylase [Bacilli bacterium]|jgi:site-specific DNA-methyltransferase (adenine-specific)